MYWGNKLTLKSLTSPAFIPVMCRFQELNWLQMCALLKASTPEYLSLKMQKCSLVDNVLIKHACFAILFECAFLVGGKGNFIRDR